MQLEVGADQHLVDARESLPAVRMLPHRAVAERLREVALRHPPPQKDLADVVPDLAWHGVDARLDGRGLQGDKQLLAAGRALADDADLSQEPKLVVTPGNVEGEPIPTRGGLGPADPAGHPEAQEE